jgi:hypothetical protein
MSKTFRKFPVAKDYSRHKTSYMKRVANKKVRKDWRVPNGRGFKKVFCSYDIIDYKFVYFDDDGYFDYRGNYIVDFGYKYESRSKAKKKGKLYSKDTIRKDCD